MADRHGPFRNNRFHLELDGTIEATFNQATIPDNSTEPIEYRTGGDPPHMRKLWGLNNYGNLTLQHGVTPDGIKLYEWRKQVQDGKMEEARMSVAVILLDEQKQDGARWEFINAWPVKYDAPDLDATANEVAIETLEIAHESMERTL